MIISGVLNIISNILAVSCCIMLIHGFGVNQYANKFNFYIALIYCCICSIIIFISYPLGFNEISIIVYPLMYIGIYRIVFTKLKAVQFYITLLVELVNSLISAGCTYIIYATKELTYSKAEFVSLFVVRLVMLTLSVIFLRNDRFKNIYVIAKKTPKYVFILLLSTLFCIDLLAIFNNYPFENELKRILFSVLIIFITTFLIIIIFSLLMNVASNNYYTALNSLLEKQVAAQISHYEKLEKLNSDMRTFRHDYINHLSSINALIGEGCYSDAQNYIDKLTESTHRNEAIFLTGNRLADAILTDKSDSCKDFADIEFDGCITDKIENSDICIILANALDNAVEACKKCPERGKISIAAQIRQGYWTMTMRNPTVGADSEGIMKTSKEDEKNHGFGLLSIEKAVKKYDGTMAVSIKDGIFEMAVVLKIPVEN